MTRSAQHVERILLDFKLSELAESGWGAPAIPTRPCFVALALPQTENYYSYFGVLLYHISNALCNFTEEAQALYIQVCMI